MLNHISTIWKYRDFLTIHKSHLDVSQLKLLKSKYRPNLSKLRKLDISLASGILFPFYSPNSSSHYDFIIRLTGYDPHLSDLAPQSLITKK